MSVVQRRGRLKLFGSYSLFLAGRAFLFCHSLVEVNWQRLQSQKKDLMRSTRTFQLQDLSKFKEQLLEWAGRFQEIVWLDGNEIPDQFSSYDAVLAAEAFTAIKTDEESGFDKLQEYQQTTADWIFGYLSYDLKNDTEDLYSVNKDGLEFPALYFFQPLRLFLIKGNVVELHYLRMVEEEMEEDFSQILTITSESDTVSANGNAARKIAIEITPAMSKQEYLERVQEMLTHIKRGDIYEANFCQEFYKQGASIRPLQVYKDLNAISQAPFSAYLKLEVYHLLCASPERYLKKKDRQLISQPIKGTATRAVSPQEDVRLMEELAADPKERAENVMIVDLVRNDLSRTATKGSVEVEELCGIYSFKQVHQMISTITSQMQEDKSVVDALRYTFPMGSMTGAPKIEAMKIIEKLEKSKRGLYSGAVGYFDPSGDFDFNVVIRSILYNAAKPYISFSVGSAITAASNPEKEYQECLVKARAMKQVLEQELGAGYSG